MIDLLDRVCLHEGFRSKPYEDSLGITTIGHGLTYLTEAESRRIVDERLGRIGESLIAARPWITEHSREVFEVLVEMSFQLGLTGCLNFKDMWMAIKVKDYVQASREMLDSKWHKQTPERCEKLAEIMRNR